MTTFFRPTPLDQQRQLEADTKRVGGTHYRATIVRDCPFCGAAGRMLQDAEIATGLAIVDGDFTYEPTAGEVLKNHYMVCSACGEDQGS